MAAGKGCPTAVRSRDFWRLKRFRQVAREMASRGVRAPGSRAHLQFIDWVHDRLDAIPGLSTRRIPISVRRWVPRRAHLRVEGAGAVKIAGPTYFTTPTDPDGISGELTYLPPDQPITESAAGKIVIRDLRYGAVPVDLLLAFASYVHGNIDDSSFERYWTAGTGAAMALDLQAAADAGAAGVLFDLGFPRSQMRDHFAHLDPAKLRVGVPALNLGADEAARLKRLSAGSNPSATLTLRANQRFVRTDTLVATLRGRSDERVVIDSHTDGVGALQEIGVAGNLALARYFASQPRSCRPRTLEFVFTTALFFGTLGPDVYAARLDNEYEDGTVALALAMEHLGAVEYEARERRGGEPGRRLVRTDRPEPAGFFASESAPLTQLIEERVIARDARRHFVSTGIRPNPTPPPPLKWLGHGSAYRDRLVPAVHHMSGPWTLLNAGPSGVKAVDLRQTRKLAMLFGDLVIGSGQMTREEIAGEVLAFRNERGEVPPVPKEGDGWRLTPRAGEHVYRAVRKYSRLGPNHRSGGRGDRRTARWIADEFRDLELETEVERVRFPQFKPTEVSLTVGADEVRAFPLYYSGITGAGGVRGRIVDVGAGSPAELAAVDLDGAIVLAAPASANRDQLLDSAARAGAVAVVLSTNAPGNPPPPDLIRAANVDAATGLCGLPTVVVSERGMQSMTAAAGEVGRLVLAAAIRPRGGRAALPKGVTRNVIAELPGRSRETVIVATPLTGWFRAASERGGGVGGLLTVARKLARRGKPPKTVVFVATGGHELGELGVRRFVEDHERILGRAGAFVNFGSTIAAKEYAVEDGQLVATGDPNPRRALSISGGSYLEELGTEAFAAVEPLGVATGTAIGELAIAAEEGVPAIGIAGSIPYFHTRGDRPRTTNARYLDPVVRGYWRLLQRLLVADRDSLRPPGGQPAAPPPAETPTCPGT